MCVWCVCKRWKKRLSGRVSERERDRVRERERERVLKSLRSIEAEGGNTQSRSIGLFTIEESYLGKSPIKKI